MKQVTFNIPDKKLGFELTNQEDNTIPIWQQKLVENRLNELDQNPEKGIDFNELITGLEKMV
ncbi:MAG: addiction module protein [Fluviicola sp.]|nr:addiction module protein [Fluviicola sp.]